MESSDLERIKSLLQSGYVEAAQHALKDILRANPKDLQAWSLYVKSWSDPVQRIKALELCLKYNPGNADAERALANLKNKVNAPAQPPKPALPPQPLPPSRSESAPDWMRTISGETSMEQAGSPASGASSFTPAPKEESRPSWMIDTSSPPRRLSNEEIDRQAREIEEDHRKQRLDIGRPMAWYEVWYTAVTFPKIDSYEMLRANPYNLPSRTILWLITAGMIFGAILALAFGLNPDISQVLVLLEQDLPGISQSFGVLLLCLIPFSGVMHLVNAAIRVGIQHLIAVLMGGEGKYSDLLYLVAAFSAPLTIVNSILAMIPLVGRCLAGPLGFYAIYLNVQAIRAAYDFDALRAFGVIFGVFLLNLIFLCLIAYLGYSYIAPYLPVQPSY